MAGPGNVLSARLVRPARGVIAQPAGPRPAIGAVAVPGQEGPPGPSAQLEHVAAVSLGGHKAVRPIIGGIALASASDIAQANTIIGITRGAALAGHPVDIAFSGELDEPTWAWAVGPVYAGEGGAITQVPPSIGFVQRLGVALSATKIAVQIGPATIKA